MYNGKIYANAKLVRDYICDKKIDSINSIPFELKNFKIYSHQLIVDDKHINIKKYYDFEVTEVSSEI